MTEPYRGEIISLIKATSIVGYIAVLDLAKMGDLVRSRTYEAFFPLIAVMLMESSVPLSGSSRTEWTQGSGRTGFF